MWTIHWKNDRQKLTMGAQTWIRVSHLGTQECHLAVDAGKDLHRDHECTGRLDLGSCRLQVARRRLCNQSLQHVSWQ